MYIYVYVNYVYINIYIYIVYIICYIRVKYDKYQKKKRKQIHFLILCLEILFYYQTNNLNKIKFLKENSREFNNSCLLVLFLTACFIFCLCFF